MPQTTRTFRVFISSTFSDLKEERNALQKYVFPRLRDLAMVHGCRFQAIDLRWGVSEEAALDQQTMKICLTEIARCQKVSPRPNFIILLGDRFGWRPLPYAIPAEEFEKIVSLTTLEEQKILRWQEGQPAQENGWYRRDDNAVPPEYVLQPRQQGTRFEEYEAWEREVERLLVAVLERAAQQAGLSEDALAKYSCSATGQEIINGALKVGDAHRHVFGFLRSITNKEELHKSQDGNVFIEADADLQQRQQNLKTRLKARLPGNLYEFSSHWENNCLSTTHIGSLPEALDDCLQLSRSGGPPESLCEAVWLKLSQVILSETENRAEANSLQVEIETHRRFGSERAGFFTGRSVLLNQISNYLDDSSPAPLVLWGESGSGKSALLAAAAYRAELRDPSAVLITRFIGASPASTTGKSLLSGLCQQIAAAVNADPKGIPTKFNELVQQFQLWLARASKEKPLTLFLDGLDQLSEDDNASSLAWLPLILPPNVKVVISLTPGKMLEDLRSRLDKHTIPFLEVGRLDQASGEQILDRWLSDAKRCLNVNQKAALLSHFQHNGLPLFLRLVFEEAVLWKSYEPVANLTDTVSTIISALLVRLERPENHGQTLISHALGLLAVSRSGLSEDELLDLLWLDDAVRADFFARSPKSPRDVQALPVVIWARLFADLEPYLAARSADRSELMNFYHVKFRQVVVERYTSDQAGFERRNLLAGYFDRQPWWLSKNDRQRPNARKVAELPYVRLQAGQWTWAVEVLTAPDFFIGHYFEHGDDFQLLMRYWSEVKQQSGSTHRIPGMEINLQVGSLYQQAWQPTLEREEYAAACGALGVFLMEIGDLEAAQYFTSAEQKAALLDVHLNAANLNDRGLNAYRQGNLSLAEEMYQKAISLFEKGDLPEASAYVNLADVYLDTGRLDEARALLEIALDLRKQHIGERTPEMATVLQGFGNLFMQQQRYPESLKYHQEALAIRKECLGSEHVDVGRSLYNVAVILFNLRKFCESYTTAQKAQEILQQAWLPGDERLVLTAKLIKNYSELTEALRSNPASTGIVIPVWHGSDPKMSGASQKISGQEALYQEAIRLADAMLARGTSLPIFVLAMPGFENLSKELTAICSKFNLPTTLLSGMDIPKSTKPDSKLDLGLIRELSILPSRFTRWIENNQLETLIVSPLHIPAGIDWKLVEHTKTCGKALVSELIPFGTVPGPVVGVMKLGGGQTKVAFLSPSNCIRQGYEPRPNDSVSTGIFYLNLIKIKSMLAESSKENSGFLKSFLKQQKGVDLNKVLREKISAALSEAASKPQYGQEVFDWFFCELVDMLGTALIEGLPENRKHRLQVVAP
jgi:tetratricopeptide (TPR) repeat protein